MPDSVEYDLPALLDGTVGSIEAKLAEMNDAQLAQLAELERGGKTRSTLLAAITAEQHGRADDARRLASCVETATDDGTPGDDASGGAGEAGSPDAGDSADGTFPDAPHPDLAVNDEGQLPVQVLRAALESAGYEVLAGDSTLLVAAQAIGELSAKVTLAAIDGPLGEAPALLPESLLELSADADADTALIVMFEGNGGRPIPELGKLTFEAADFVQDSGGRSRTLARPIVFPTDVAGCDVRGVWLLDDDLEPWSRCALIGSLPVGGGRQATIPAHYLRFDAPATVKAAA